MRVNNLETHPAIEQVTAEESSWLVDTIYEQGSPRLERLSREADGTYALRVMHGTTDVSDLDVLARQTPQPMLREEAHDLRARKDMQWQYRPMVQPALRALFRAGYLEPAIGGGLVYDARTSSFNRKYEISRRLEVGKNGELSIAFQHPHLDYDGQPVESRTYMLPRGRNYGYHLIRWANDPIAERHVAVNPHLILGVFKAQLKEIIKIAQRTHLKEHDEVLPQTLSA